MIDPQAPFVLLDERGGGARLFQNPVDIFFADAPDQVGSALNAIAAAGGRGLHAAGFLAYEAGYALEARLMPLAAARKPEVPLAWFGLFDAVETIAPEALARLLPDPAGATAAEPVPGISRDAYEASVRGAAALIAAGDIYQANLSFPNDVRFAGHPLALYAGLRERARAHWGGVLFTGAHWLLSASPELFFTLTAGKLVARPIKGTAARLPDPAADPVADAAAAAALLADPKQRAENLMIVDLTRNDLSRVSRAGSVRVPRLFEVETFPTVHHLTSTIEAELAPGLGPVDVLRAAFPCGSITGAPKIRAMEAIATLEPDARGAYTGSLGWIAPGGDAAFNVMIRTLTVADGAAHATLGLGAGIVADSRPAAEWRECLAKGGFVTRGQRPIDLLETMRFDPEGGVFEVDRHLERLAASAAALGFAFNRHDARNQLQAATFRLQHARTVRLRLARGGALAVEVRDLPPVPTTPVDVALCPLPVSPHDFRLRHKTSDRGFYDDARAAAGTFEVVFVDAEGRCTEGSFTNLFVEAGGILLTPPLGRGLLPGVLRAGLIAQGRAREADLTPGDLRDGLLVGNALRGLLRARLV